MCKVLTLKLSYLTSIIKFQGHKLNDGVECQLRIIAGQDNTTDDQGLSNPGQSTVEIYDDCCPTPVRVTVEQVAHTPLIL